MKKITILLMILLSLAVPADAQNFPEQAKIRYLIASVEALQGAQFIRNGHAYDVRAASDHLHMKLKKAGNRVKTAEDFINLCASKSYLTGEPYRIRFADGKTVQTEVFLRNRLRAYKGGSSPGHAGGLD